MSVMISSENMFREGLLDLTIGDIFDESSMGGLGAYTVDQSTFEVFVYPYGDGSPAALFEILLDDFFGTVSQVVVSPRDTLRDGIRLAIEEIEREANR